MTNIDRDVTWMRRSSTTAAPAVVPLTTKQTREQRRDKRRVEAQAEHWLAHQSVPEHLVLCYERWRDRSPVIVDDPAHLARLIASLREGDYGGVKLHGSEGNAKFMIELHPYTHEDEPGGMYFERVVPVKAVVAGALRKKAWEVGTAFGRMLPSARDAEPRS
jgi:hypothetical protein